MGKRSKGTSKSQKRKQAKQVPDKTVRVIEPSAPFHVVTPGGKDAGFSTETEVGAYLRSYLNAGGGDYVVARGDGTPIEFDPYAGHLYSREEAVDELTAARHKMRDMIDQLNGYRTLKNRRASEMIAAGLIPLEVLKGHVQMMAYDGTGGKQVWQLTLASYGPQLTEDAPLGQALVALTDHLSIPEDETIGNPDDAAAVVTDLPDVV